MVKLADARWGYLITFILLTGFIVYPVASPIPVLSYLRALYDYIEALPPGSLVVVSVQYGTPGPSFHPFALAFSAHALRNDLRTIWVCPTLGVLTWVDTLIRWPGYDWFDPANGKVYGVDFVNLGFIAGEEAGIAAMASDPHGVFSVDYYGNDLSQYPIWNDFNIASDVDFLMVIFDMLPDPPTWLRQWQQPYGVPTGLHHYAAAATWLPYYYAGQFVGISSDLPGGAAYETLVGRLGKGIGLMTTQSALHLFLATVIVAGSVVHIYQRYIKQEEE